MNATITISSIFFYSLATLLIVIRLFNQDIAVKIPRIVVLVITSIAVLLHLFLLTESIITRLGINLSFFNAASASGWLLAVVLLLSSMNKPVENLGIAIYPLVILSILLSQFMPSSILLTQKTGWELSVHVFSSLLAWSMLTIASFQAVLLWFQDRSLHNHHPGGVIGALPALQTMESLLFEFISVGLLLLSVSLISGFMFLDDMFSQRLVHKTVLSLAAWVVFAALLFGRYQYGWRGKTALRWTLTGFIVLLLAYFGSKAVLELILQQA